MKQLTDLTALQNAVLQFTASYVYERGYQPLMWEIAQACGFSSMATVKDCLKALDRKGYIFISSRRINFLHIPNFAYARQITMWRDAA